METTGKDSTGQRRPASYCWWPMFREEQRAKLSNVVTPIKYWMWFL